MREQSVDSKDQQSKNVQLLSPEICTEFLKMGHKYTLKEPVMVFKVPFAFKMYDGDRAIVEAASGSCLVGTTDGSGSVLVLPPEEVDRIYKPYRQRKPRG